MSSRDSLFQVNGQGQVEVKVTRQLVPQLTQVHEAVHHLRYAEAVAEVVERVVAVVLLHAQLNAPTHTGNCITSDQVQLESNRALALSCGRPISHITGLPVRPAARLSLLYGLLT